MRPVLFEIGPIPIHSFGVMLIVAFFAGLWLARKRAPRYGFTPTEIGDVAFWGLFVGVLGARIVFILQDLPHFLARPEELFSFRFAGLTSFGGILFGVGFVALWSKLKGKPFASLLDVLGLPMMLGHAIGRVGCLLNGCCYGGPCQSWYCLPVLHTGLSHNPAQLLDAALNLVGILVIVRWERRGLAPGQAFGLFLIFHNVARFIYEFWRAGTVAEVKLGLASSTYMGNLPITQAQVAAVAVALLGVAMYVLG
jgi:phosphatidylglycerol---prolipoprotein diacylglyceryl transferase